MNEQDKAISESIKRSLATIKRDKRHKRMRLLKKLLIKALIGLTVLAFAFMLSGAFFLWICAPDNPNDYNAHDLALYQQTMTAGMVGIISAIAAALLSGITQEDL